MRIKIGGLAIICLFAFGCHAPAKRAPKAPVDPNSLNAKQKATPCDVQGALTAALTAKHPDLLNLKEGQFGSPITTLNSYGATFDLPAASTKPTTAPASADQKTTDQTSTSTASSVTNPQDSKPTDPPPAVDPATPATPASPPAPAAPMASQVASSMVASIFIDPSSCNVVSYAEGPVTGALSDTISSCVPNDDDAKKFLGKNADSKKFTLVKYDPSVKSPNETYAGMPVFEVFTEADGTDGSSTLTQYLIAQPTCQISFPDTATLAAPGGSAKPKKSGS